MTVTPDTTIRWGILGTGKIARAFASALRDTPGATLAAVASRSIDSAQAFGRDFDVPACFGDYAALAHFAGVDIVYIATPHSSHADNAKLALHGGKAVLCEKPFTINLREALEVVALARERGLFLMEAMWTRFLPAMDVVRQLLADDAIGRVTQLNADFGFMSTMGLEHRLHNRALGGGALLDLGVYPLSVATDLLGPVEASQALSLAGATGVDETTAFSLRHRSGAVSNCLCSMRARSPIELTISGERGFIRMHTPFYKTQTVSLSLADGSLRTIPAPFLGNGYVHEAIEAGRCLRAGLSESARMPLDASLAQMAVLDAMRAQIGLRYPADA